MLMENIRIHANFDYSQRAIWGGCKWGMRLEVIRNIPALLNKHLLGCRVSPLKAKIRDLEYLKRFSTEQVQSILLLFPKQWKYNNYYINIYTLLGLNNTKIISSTWKNVCELYTNHAPFCMWNLVSMGEILEQIPAKVLVRKTMKREGWQKYQGGVEIFNWCCQLFIQVEN